MDKSYRIERLRTDGYRLIDTAETDLAAMVPSCPGWDNAKLLSHTARVWAMLGLHVSRRVTAPLDRSLVPKPPADGLALFARDQLETLLAVLADLDPAEPMWTWAADQSGAFYLRRAHQETMIHRVDAELAVDSVTALPAEDSVDGLDELFTVMYRAGVEAPQGSLHLHRTDGEGEWMLRARPGGGVEMSHEHAKGDAALRGSAEDLLLAMWARRGYGHIESFGDSGVVDAWIALAP